MKERIEALGFVCHAREGGCVVALEEWQAQATMSGLTVALPFAGNPIARQVVLHLLGAVRVRSVGASLENAGATLQAPLPADFSDDQLLAALEGLIVACRLVAKPVSLLANDALAERFLAHIQPTNKGEPEHALVHRQ